jgi:alpha-galactosidase
MIKVTGNLFVLETCNTSYCFEKNVSGHLEHLYYGKKINLDEKNVSALREKNAFVPGCSLAYDKDFSDVCLEDMKLEMS